MPETPAILISDCLQNDFVQPLGRYEPLPNLLHIGHDEARRLMGDDPVEGPVACLMRWAHAQPAAALQIIHVRDWHDADDPAQAPHLQRFGSHCIAGTQGARFVFAEQTADAARPVHLVDALTLNNFAGTTLPGLLSAHAGQPLRVGLTGVWTEAKITFLAYELRTRHPEFELAVCSALTASSSRAQHFLALDQLEKLLGVAVFPSVGQFIEFLGGARQQVPLRAPSGGHPELTVDGAARLEPGDDQLLRYLFRDCRTAGFNTLDGGYSGNVVLGSESEDLLGHRQVPHVVKIGPRDLIGSERAAFERIEAVLGNSAPSVTDFADLGERGAIKYRYASMGGGFSTTFQKRYCAGIDHAEVRRILDTVFIEQLGRLYSARELERCDLLDYYAFSPRFAPGVRRRVEALVPDASGARLDLPGGLSAPNVCRFYEQELEALPRAADHCQFAYIHGDLNGANIVIDGGANVWIIDFFHTQRGHVLRDLLKLENDLLFIFTPVAHEAAFVEACRLSDLLLGVEDLAQALPPPEQSGLTLAPLQRCYQTVTLLRSYYPALVGDDRDPLQALIGKLRYAVHTLSFGESSRWQKLWALYTAGHCAERVGCLLRRLGPLRVDWIDAAHTAPGRLGLTILPGRRDYARDLAADVQALVDAGVQHVVCLLSDEELTHYGCAGAPAAYAAAGLAVSRQPMPDQGVCSVEQMDRLVEVITTALAAGERVMVHCVGGLGRSGTVAACVLKALGLDTKAAITAVRAARSPRAIESSAQEAFVEQRTTGTV